MSAQHTPGPWLQSHRQGADGMYQTVVYSQEHGVIATCAWTVKHCGNGVTATYREANARLIAAAPDLLDVLKEIVEMWDAFVPTELTAEPHLKARAAITKATKGDTP